MQGKIGALAHGQFIEETAGDEGMIVLNVVVGVAGVLIGLLMVAFGGFGGLLGLLTIALSIAQFFHPKLALAIIPVVMLAAVWDYFFPHRSGWH